MHRAEFGSAVSPIMTMPHFALILEITPLNQLLFVWFLLQIINDTKVKHLGHTEDHTDSFTNLVCP